MVVLGSGFDPVGRAVRGLLGFPERGLGLEPVDQEGGRLKGWFAMGGGGENENDGGAGAAIGQCGG